MVLSCLVIVTYAYYVDTNIFKGAIVDKLFTALPYDHLKLYRFLAGHLGTLLMLFAVPLAVLTLFNRFSAIKLSPVRYTFTLGDFRAGMKLLAAFVLIITVSLLLFAIFKPSHFRAYPLCNSKLVLQSTAFFLLFEFGQFLYLIGFEYFCRGYLLMETERRYGYDALAITILPYVILKFGRAPIEIYTAIPIGLAFGYMTLRTRSFWYTVIAHTYLALINEPFTYMSKQRHECPCCIKRWIESRNTLHVPSRTAPLKRISCT